MKNKILNFQKKIVDAINFLLYSLVFLLPFQTRWIFSPAFLNGNFWEYGTKSLYATELLMWLIVILFIFDSIKNKIWPSKRSLAYCFIVILFFGINIFFSTSRDITWYFILHIVEAMGIVFVIYKSNISIHKLLVFFWAGGVVQGIFAFVQFLSQRTWSNKWLGLAEHLPSDLGAAVIETAHGRWLRAYGSFGWPNSLGIYLAVVWIIGIILYLHFKNKNIKLLFLCGQFFILIGLLFSFSRGAWLSTLVGFAALGIFILKTKREVIKSFLEHALYSVFLILSIVVIFHFLFFARFNLESRLENRSVSERTEQVAEFKTILQKNPKIILVGLGGGAFTAYLHKQYPELPVWEIQPIHTIFLLSFIEIGILFFIFHILLFFFLIKKIIKNNVLLLCPIFTLLTMGLFDHWMWTLYTGQLLWFVVWGFGIKNNSLFE